MQKGNCNPKESGNELVRVIHMIDTLDRGGAAQVLVDMVVGLDKTKYAPTVCLTRPNEMSLRIQELQDNDIPLLILERTAWYQIGAWKPLLTWLETVDILHSHSESSNMWARVWGTFKRVPVIVTQEHKAPTKKSKVFKLIDRVLGPLSTRIIAVSHFDKEQLVTVEKQDPARVEVLHNGIAPERFNLPLSKQEARVQAGFPTDDILFTMIGRLEVQKKHEFFFEAFAQLLSQTNKTLYAVIAGSGTRTDKLKTIVDRLALTDHVLFIGERTDVPVLLKAADALVLSSIWECLPLVVLEALAAQCPVIATDVGGTREALKEGEAGTLVPYGDLQELVDALRLVVEQSDIITAKVATGYKWVTSYFCKARMVAELDELYQHLLGEIPH